MLDSHQLSFQVCPFLSPVLGLGNWPYWAALVGAIALWLLTEARAEDWGVGGKQYWTEDISSSQEDRTGQVLAGSAAANSRLFHCFSLVSLKVLFTPLRIAPLLENGMYSFLPAGNTQSSRTGRDLTQCYLSYPGMQHARCVSYWWVSYLRMVCGSWRPGTG